VDPAFAQCGGDRERNLSGLRFLKEVRRDGDALAVRPFQEFDAVEPVVVTDLARRQRAGADLPVERALGHTEKAAGILHRQLHGLFPSRSYPVATIPSP
jgi:hypothetical protein